MKYEFLEFSKSGDIATITINRPERMNALNKKTRDEIRSALDEAKKDNEVRSIILTGAGDRAFSSGQDLEESAKFNAKYAKEWINEFDSLYLKILSTPKPIVTSCPGYATGAGLQAFLLGDYRISSDNGKFGMTEVDIGIPCITGSAILKPLIGLSQIPRMTLMCEMIGAEEARHLGLVHKVVPHNELKSTTHEVAKRLAEKPSTAVNLQKEWIYKLYLDDLKKGVAQAKISHTKAFASGEPQELMRAFIEKRSKK
jgi:enoyl-CoA hydratase/carnithine racemase